MEVFGKREKVQKKEKNQDVEPVGHDISGLKELGGITG